MAATTQLLGWTGVLLSQISRIQGQDTCGEEHYVCEQGHCCGHGRCCTNYYELWGFWVLWVTVAVLVGCCYYQQKRLRRQALPFIQRSRRSRRPRSGRRPRSRSRSRSRHRPPPAQRVGASPEALTPVFQPDKMLRLPTYEEIKDMPKDPPAYSIIFNETRLPETVLAVHTTGGATGRAAPEGPLVGGSEISDSPQAYLLANEAGTSEDHVVQAPPTDAPPPYSSGPPPYPDHAPDSVEMRTPDNESTSRLTALFIR